MPVVTVRLLLAWCLTAVCLAVSRRDPGWEPPLREYYGLDASSKSPAAAKRMTNLSREEFDRLARSGVPFVVTDGGRGLPMRDWNCEYMQKHFGDVRFRQEYGGEKNNHIFSADWTRKKKPIKGRKLPPGAPKYAPFYSDVVKARRDEPERKWGKASAAIAMERAIVAATKTPYFMNEGNLGEMRRNPEFWLQPPETGSMAHMDEHCISTIATTLSGVKRWRLASIPERPHPQGYFDGLVYERNEWDPLFEFETRPGESVVFPPGMIHEGLSVGEDCVSSITYQFSLPSPVAYWRTFFPRVRRTHDMRGCLRGIASWATLNEPSYSPRPYNEALQHAEALAKRLDTDSDGYLSAEEISPRFQGAGGDSPTVADALGYHDTNGDATTSVEEFMENFAVWSAVELKAQEDGVDSSRDPNEL